MTDNSDNLSIEETNKLREQLGLKPLDVSKSNDDGNNKKKDEYEHKPASNLKDNFDKDKFKEKIRKHRLNTELNEILKNESLVENKNESTMDFMSSVFKKNELKKMKMTSKEDEVNEKKSSSAVYSSEHLQGLKVQHKPKRFDNHVATILTLKDQDILDDSDEVLVNVNLLEEEKTAKLTRNKRRGFYDDPIDSDDEDEDILSGLKPKNILAKYDEDINGDNEGIAFKLDNRGTYSMTKERIEQEYRAKLDKGRVNLNLSEFDKPKVASDYFSADEMLGKIRKPVKSRLKTKKLVKKKEDNNKHEEGEVEDEEGAVNGRLKEKNRVIVVDNDDEDEEEDFWVPGSGGFTMTSVLNEDLKRELEERKTRVKPEKMEVDIKEEVKIEELSRNLDGNSLLLKNTEEFTDVLLRKLDTKQIRMRRENKEANDAMEIPKLPEKSPVPSPKSPSENSSEEDEDEISTQITKRNINIGGWQPEENLLQEAASSGSTANINHHHKHSKSHNSKHRNYRKPQEKKDVTATRGILGDDIVVGSGLYSAALYAQKNGYLDDNKPKSLVTNKRNDELRAKDFIEEKIRYDDGLDNKLGRRERNAGPLVAFEDKKDFKPDVKLEYVDESGKTQSQKEAFRALSHRFHGKGSGKIKTEKRKHQNEVDETSGGAINSLMGSTDFNVDKFHSICKKMKKERKITGADLIGKKLPKK